MAILWQFLSHRGSLMAPRLLQLEYPLAPMIWSAFEHFLIPGSIICRQLFHSFTDVMKGASPFGHCLRKDLDAALERMKMVKMEPFHIYFVAGTPLKSYIWLPCPCQTSSKPLPPTFCNFLLCYVLYKVCALQHTGVIVEKHNFINGRQPAARHLRRPSAFALLP